MKRILILDREERSKIREIFFELSRRKSVPSFEKFSFPRINNILTSVSAKDFMTVNSMNVSSNCVFPIDLNLGPSDRKGVIIL